MIACTVKNLLLFQIGLAYGIAISIIPELRSTDPEINDGFWISAEESSWSGMYFKRLRH